MRLAGVLVGFDDRAVTGLHIIWPHLAHARWPALRGRHVFAFHGWGSGIENSKGLQIGGSPHFSEVVSLAAGPRTPLLSSLIPQSPFHLAKIIRGTWSRDNQGSDHRRALFPDEWHLCRTARRRRRAPSGGCVASVSSPRRFPPSGPSRRRTPTSISEEELARRSNRRVREEPRGGLAARVGRAHRAFRKGFLTIPNQII